MESALVIINTEKSVALIAELLRAHSVFDVVHARSAGEARRMLLERDFDLVVINAPMPDETGESLARQVAARGIGQVILIVKSEIFESVAAVCEQDGVLTVARPVGREMFFQVLSLAEAMHARLKKARFEDKSLKQKIDTIRIIDRAKSVLITSRGMSEHEAHRYIEKKAMDTRTSKCAIGKRIINDYENGTEGAECVRHGQGHN